MKPIINSVLAGWFATVLVLGASGAIARQPGMPPIPILIAAAGPVLVFLAAYRVWPSFREYVRSLDVPLATAIQAWRAGGLGFLALYAYHVLPASFAWPAGLGDIAIGVTAPWIARALVRHPGFGHSRLFRIWNLLGILDLVVAVTVGGLNSALATGTAGEVTTGPMAHLPLVLIPAFLVPLFVMLHLAVLFEAPRPVASTVETVGR